MEIKLLPEEIADLQLRRQKLSDIMSKTGTQALLASSSVNVFYLAGSVFRGYVYLTAQGTGAIFLIKGQAYSQLPTIHIRKPELLLEAITSLGMPVPTNIALEFDSTYHNEFLRLEKCFPNATITNASPLLREARKIKTPWEIKQMRADGVHHVEVYRRISKLYRQDMTDLEFQIEIERELRREGSLGYLRTAGSSMELNMGSVLAGKNADTPSPYDFSMGGQGINLSLPVGANGTQLKPGITVMVDMNGNFNGYQTDITRVWRIGHPGSLAIKAHQTSCAILSHLEKTAKPGTKISDLCQQAYSIVEQADLSKYFMGFSSQARFIGHGVGIELNEQPVLMLRNHEPIMQGMTIAIEPKFVIPEVGAVGNENTYLVTNNGLENLTPASPEMAELI